MKYIILVMSLILSSCSTLKKSIIYPSIGGAVLGGAAGYTLSDEDKGHSKSGNAAIYGGLGALLGAGLGLLLYKDHPDNQKLTHAMEVTPPFAPIKKESPFEVSLKKKKAKKELVLKAQNEDVIPEELKSKLKRPRVKIYEIPERVIEKDGKQVVIEKTKGYEYVIE